MFLQQSNLRKLAKVLVLGAINALTYQIIMVTNESYINAESVCELLDKGLFNFEVHNV